MGQFYKIGRASYYQQQEQRKRLRESRVVRRMRVCMAF